VEKKRKKEDWKGVQHIGTELRHFVNSFLFQSKWPWVSVFELSVKHHMINDSISLISPTVRSIWIRGTISDRLSIHNKYLKVLDGEDER
jgi:hypothetical protein